MIGFDAERLGSYFRSFPEPRRMSEGAQSSTASRKRSSKECLEKEPEKPQLSALCSYFRALPSPILRSPATFIQILTDIVHRRSMPSGLCVSDAGDSLRARTRRPGLSRLDPA